MSDLVIFMFGLVVTVITATATMLIGMSEAADKNHARPQDLSGIEKKIVGTQRPEQSAG